MRALIPLALVAAICGIARANKEIVRPLPAIAQKPEISRIRAAHPRIEHHRQRYLRKEAAGHTPSAKKQAAEQKIQLRAQQLKAKVKASKDNRPVLIILEGGDGAGKSSTIRRLTPAFEGARKVKVLHFGAPPPGANQVHWIKRFFDQLPGQGEVAIWDRSYYGRAVYETYHGLIKDKAARRSIKEIRAFERLLSKQMRVVKIYLDVSADRQAKTIAKREVKAPEKLAESDYKTLDDRKPIKRLFKRAMNGTGRPVPWNVVPMDDRAAGRLQIFDILDASLN